MGDETIVGISDPDERETPVIRVKQQNRILFILGVVLVIFASALAGIGLISMFHVAADPQAVNASREQMGGWVTYILGVFSGLIVGGAMGASVRKP